MRIQNNIPALITYGSYRKNNDSLSKNLEKLSSGYQINRSADDAAGLTISEKMRAQITGMNSAQKNVKDGISLAKVADGALTEVHSMLNRMYALAEQSANGTYASVDRAGLQNEVESLKAEIDRIVNTANFNGQKLLNGDLAHFSPSVVLVSGVSRNVSNVQFMWGPGVEGNIRVAGELNEAMRTSNSSFTITTKSSYGSAGQEMIEVNFPSFSIGPFSAKPESTQYKGETIPGQLTYTITGRDGVVGSLEVRLSTSPPHPIPSTVSNTFRMMPGGKLTLQIGESAEAENKLTLQIDDCRSMSLGVSHTDVSTQDSALGTLDTIQHAIDYVSSTRGRVGAYQNRLEHTMQNLSVSVENLQNAESVIRDTDVASAMMEYTKNSILTNAAQSMLAQANQQPQGVLQLLQ